MSQDNTINLDECWLYARYKDPNGYGRLKLKIQDEWTTFVPHRVMYEAMVGTIPKGLVLDHLCRVPSCINPSHLEAVTDKINILRGVGPTAVNSKKTHCKLGHQFVIGSKRRFCRECNRTAKQKSRAIANKTRG